MEQLPQHNYDKSSVVFSPEGKIPQIEYAREAIKRGTTAMGMKTNDGIVLISLRPVPNKLIELNSINKIYQIDDHIFAITVGMIADARILIDKARIESQINMATFDEPIQIETLVKKVCDFIYAYTQSGGIRPFGTSLLIAGHENNIPRLFETDPAGTFFEYKAIVIGAGKSGLMPILEKEYTNDLNSKEAIVLGLKILKNHIKIIPDNLEIAIIEKNNKYHKLNPSEIEQYLEN